MRCCVYVQHEQDLKMTSPINVSYRGIEPSEAIESRIEEHAAKLDRFFGRSLAYDIVIEMPHQHHQKGNLYNIRIHISMPGGDVAVDHAGRQDHAHEDVNVAIRDAFDAARRQLQDRVRRMQGDVKQHSKASPPQPGKG